MTKIPFDLNYEKLLKPSREMSQVAVDNAKEIARINQQAAQEMAAAFQERVSELLKGQDPKVAFDYVHAEVLQDAAKEVAHYHQQLLDVLRNGNKELSEIAEEMIQNSKADLIHFVNDATNNAPIGSEAYVSVFKTSFNNALQNFELVRAAMADSFANFEKSVESVTNLTAAKGSSKKK